MPIDSATSVQLNQPSAAAVTPAPDSSSQSLLGRITAVFVYVFEKIMPDPFVFAVLLTFLGAATGMEVCAERDANEHRRRVVRRRLQHLHVRLPDGADARRRIRTRYVSSNPSGLGTHCRTREDARIRHFTDAPVRARGFVAELGTWPRHCCAACARDRQARPHRLRLAGRCRLQRLRHLDRRSFRFDRALASHAWLRAQHRREGHRPWPAPLADSVHALQPHSYRRAGHRAADPVPLSRPGAGPHRRRRSRAPAC